MVPDLTSSSWSAPRAYEDVSALNYTGSGDLGVDF
jgi:hypothetical protein